MRNILVTGCSTGFGQNIALRLIEDSNNFVIVTMRNAEGRDHAFKELKNTNFVVLSLDVTKKEEREKVANYIQENLDGKLNILINNAGLGHYGPIELTTEEELRRQLEVNFFAPTFMIKNFLPFLRMAKGKKKIINISSMLGQVGMPLSGTYSASKHALEGLVEGMHFELAPFDIDIVTVCPGRHRTKFMNNISWSSIEDKDKLYQTQNENLRSIMAKFSQGKEIPLSNVSKKVVGIVNGNSTPSRVYVGSDAKGFYYLRKLMPFNMLMKLFKRMYKGLIEKKVSHARS